MTFVERCSNQNILSSGHESKEIQECTICHEVMKSRGSFRKHMRDVHSSVEFPCDLCDRIFKNPDTLKLHINSIHEKESKFKCDICDKTLSLNSDMKQHQLELHGLGEAMHICHFCAKAFISLKQFNIHFKQRHGKEAHQDVTLVASDRLKTFVYFA